MALRLRELDDDIIEDLLDGTGPAPEGYERVAEVLGRLRERHAPEPDEVLVTRMQAIVEQQLAGGGSTAAGRLRRLVLVGVIAGGALVALAGLGAAGALPDGLQRPVSDVLGTVGIDAPSPDDTNEAPADDGSTDAPADGGVDVRRSDERQGDAPAADAGAGDVSAVEEGATPAVPAIPATPADPGGAGPATPAVPAEPATPSAGNGNGNGPPADAPSGTAPGQVDPGPNGNGKGHGYGRGGRPAADD